MNNPASALTSKVCRLVFSRLESNSHVGDAVSILCGEFMLPKAKVIKRIKSKEPGILLSQVPHAEAENLRRRLLRLDCLTTVEPLLINPDYPFPLTLAHSRRIAHELAKADRAKTTLVFVLANVEPSQQEKAEHITLMGQPAIDMEEFLRLSDTVLVLDDNRLAVLGFTTAHEHAEVLVDKVLHRLCQTVGSDGVVTAGHAAFPTEGKCIAELLRKSEARRKAHETQLEHGTNGSGQAAMVAAVDSGSLDEGYLAQVFHNAYGRQFQKLITTLPPDVLYAALRRLKATEQRDFLSRLAYDSPLTGDLTERFRTEAPCIIDPVNAVADCMEPALFFHELDVRRISNIAVMRKLENTQALPTLPGVAMQIFEMASNPHVSIQQLASVISMDPALSSKLLQVVNSPFYGFSAKIVDIRRAVVLLGINDVMDIVLGLAASKVLKTSAVTKMFNPRYLWHHSYVTGLLAASICKKLSPKKQSWVFTTALLHDIGKIFFAEQFPEAFKNVVANAARFDIQSCELEMETFGVCHATVGKIMASKWNFPEVVIEGIAYHHAPSKETHNSGMPAVVGFADYLYNMSIDESYVDEVHVYKPASLSHGQWKMLTYYFSGLSKERMAGMKSLAIDLIKSSKSILDMY